MKLVAVSKNSVRESTTKRFGFGYEKKSSNCPSTETARAEFLSLVLEITPDVVSSLFNAAYPQFCSLIAGNEDLIASLCYSVESEIPEENYNLRQPKYIRPWAIKRFIPNWHSVKQRADADSLQVAFKNWARGYNLTADWCLDHALDFLREFEASEYKEFAFRVPDPHLLVDLIRRAWQSASVNRHCHALGTQYHSNADVEERGVFSFIFEYERIRFEVPGPFNKFIPAFKQEVEKSFIALGGPSIPGAREALRYKLPTYLEEVEKVRKELGLEEPPVRWTADDHFRWLINYQITCMNYREIGRIAGKNDKTVREGIQDVAELIGLKLRSAQADKYRGRPKGAKDKAPRRRIDRRREKVRGNAN
jgi:hypothetical protein